MKQSILFLFILFLSLTGCSRVDLNNPTERSNYALGRSIGMKYSFKGSNIDADTVVDAVTAYLKNRNSSPPSEEKQSYDLGVNIGRRMKAASITYHETAFTTGFEEAMENEPNRITKEDMTKILGTIEKSASENQQKLSKDFFSKTNKYILTTASGLRYKIITKGTGKRPLRNSTVQVHYKGSFIDGTEFDSTYKTGQPMNIPLQKVIPGWQEGLTLMNEGSTYIFYIPPKLGYDEKGRGIIPGNAALVYEIQLINISQ